MVKPPQAPAPTVAEVEILSILWRNGACTVREVHAEIDRAKPVTYTTTLKQMQLMHQKGLLKRNERFRSHVYEPAQPRTAVQQQLTRTLLRQAFEGSARELLQSALAGRPVDSAEIAEIKRLLSRYEKKKGTK
jgi:BlaI family transcriptional regulator, penicillinase repressor